MYESILIDQKPSLIIMQVNIKYQIVLRNNNKILGNIKTKTGILLQQIKCEILQIQGIKNISCFIQNESNDQKITLGKTCLLLMERTQKTGSTSKVKDSRPSSKVHDDSVYEVSSMDYDNQAKEYLAIQPQKPPIVRGQVKQSNSFFCCIASTKYLQLQITQLKFYTSEKYTNVDRIIYVNDILKIKTYRKKHVYFIKIEQEEEALDFKFGDKKICKQWMGYLMQAMQFNKYLNEKKLFSKAESFKKFVVNLIEQSSEIVYLNPRPSHEKESFYEELPQQQTISRISSKFVKLSQFQIKYKIGSGSFSLIYLAHKGNQTFALKQINKQKLLLKNQMKYAMTQLKVLMKGRGCRYIIPLYYAFQTPDYLYMALQYVPTGNLGQYLKRIEKIELNEAMVLLSELVIAIEYLHSRNIMYRDLKPQNVLLSPKGHIYLVDFGLSKELQSENQYAESFLGTPLYLAPERFTGKGLINIKSDIYGVGCIFYEILHGQSPFFANNYGSLVHKIKNDHAEIRQNLPYVVKDFLRKTLQKDPEKRLSQMSEHDIFKKVNWKQIKEQSHAGLRLNESSIIQNVQIDYKIDEDYTQQNFPNKFISNWSYNFNTNQ